MSDKERMDARERFQRDVSERLKNYKSYDDFLRQYESHREKSSARSHLYREEGFQELNDKYGTEYDPFERMGDMRDPMNKNYHIYRAHYEQRYWDTKENHAYYSLPVGTRAWLTLKRVSAFWGDYAVLWLGIAPLLILFNARTRSGKTRLSGAEQQ